MPISFIPSFDKNLLYKVLGLIKISLAHQLAKKLQWGGAFFLLASSEICGKKLHPPGAFHEKPL